MLKTAENSLLLGVFVLACFYDNGIFAFYPSLSTISPGYSPPLHQSRSTCHAATGSDETYASSDPSTTRSQFLQSTIALLLASSPAHAFDGGVGGLGKTKPETGVVLFSDLSAPVQNAAGIVSAELNIQNQPVLVTFQTPWPLLPTTGGLEARDLQQAESAFVQVVTENVPKENPLTKQSMKKLLMTSVFNQQGKFSAYGQPIDIKVKGTDDAAVFAVSFTTFTPGMRESERQTLIKYSSVGSAIVLLITGTTSIRYRKQEPVFQAVAKSFTAVAAPSSKMR
ncbi:expressed unknown protein [Seminavis robusta]|uniref:Uncharacterized protein n=1 Tax=Seminavis robusta TaxID=568900 RepID=A0A9N8D9B9_9STRA|nr:expressed unknown protein [Seminavis robusta]|eukprot:Sro44_g026510.1 n/a (282) ;mRNA; r:26663-27654